MNYAHKNQPDEALNWRFILLLSGLGVLAGIIVTQEFAEALPPWLFPALILVVIPGSLAGWVIQKTAARHFHYGCLVGSLYHAAMVCTIAILGILPVAQDEYVRAPNKAFYVVTRLIAGLIVLTLACIAGAILGLIPGLWWGFIVWLFGKIAKARKTNNESISRN